MTLNRFIINQYLIENLKYMLPEQVSCSKKVFLHETVVHYHRQAPGKLKKTCLKDCNISGKRVCQWEC